MTYPYLGELAEWINGRWSIYQKKEEQGLPPPWSTNHILNTYRFCNVHRENDRVTRWIAKHWRDPHAEDPWLWHRMLIARMINWPPTLDYLGYPLEWDADAVKYALWAWQMAGNKVFTGAYIVSTNGRKMDKIEYVVWVLDEAYKKYANSKFSPVNGSLAGTHRNLMQLEAVGSFIAAQVVADLKHTPQLSIRVAKDWYDWAAPGPGSMRGLNRLMGKALDIKWRNPNFSNELLRVREHLEPLIEWVPDLCLQDLQNCLCEFDKYMRIKEGGKVRAKYYPHTYPV